MLDVRVLTVDDQDAFRRVARELLECTPGFVPVGEASSGAAAVDAVTTSRPELVLLDVRMPGVDGIETARRIRAAHPDVVVVLVSAEDLEDLPPAAGGCGAAACVRKQDLGPRRLTRLWSAVGTRPFRAQAPA